jgi:putative membrane-bound dehydrogenase-like protein
MIRPILIFILCTSLAAVEVNCQEKSISPEDGIELPAGFEVKLYADNDLAHDIYSMTLDSKGRVVVSSRGYVRTLIDDDGDGLADRFTTFVDGPASGAQGMFFDGPDLLCVAGEGLIRYRDQDGDGQADGKPEVIWRVRAGGEHHAHSIQRGPDGWWYMAVGNMAGVTAADFDPANSAIRQPRAGTVVRISPDFTQREVVAEGYRNAYDFSFNAQGDIFLFDSDGERDVTLPWYRPTRVFQVIPGSHAGWFSRSWKRPGYFFDMPTVIGSLGRGSPTGVTCYRHHQFPRTYHGALFVLDWSFGRVIALPLEADGSSWKSTPHDFMTGKGLFGFAPTDIEVGPEGELYVSVGGRGTRGSVYVVRWKSPTGAPGEGHTGLIRCLATPQPLSSWSRSRWLPLAAEVGRDELLAASRTEDMPAPLRLRAIELLTEFHGGLDQQTLEELVETDQPSVAARAAWSIGRTISRDKVGAALVPWLDPSRHPLVLRCALESLLGGTAAKVNVATITAIEPLLEHPDRYVRTAAARVVARCRLDPATAELVAELSVPTWARALGDGDHPVTFRPELMLEGLGQLTDRQTAEQQLALVRMAQLAIGDLGAAAGTAAVFEGYSTSRDLREYKELIGKVVGRLEEVYPVGELQVDNELARLMAMIRPSSPLLLERVLAQVTAESSPSSDLHHLIVAARNRAPRSSEQRGEIARALVQLRYKVDSRKLKLDSNWDPRLTEMYLELVKLDPALPQAVIEQPGFGLSDHAIYLKPLSPDNLQSALDLIAGRIVETEDYPWTAEIVRLLGRSTRPGHRQLLREQLGNYSIQGVVLSVLAGQASPLDRPHFVDGLESANAGVVGACLSAIATLPVSKDPRELVRLVYNLRRLNHDETTWRLRESVVLLLRRATGRQFGFVLGKEGYKPQQQVVDGWTSFIAKAHPAQYQAMERDSEVDLAALKKRLEMIEWESGERLAGEKLFVSRSCRSCHGSRGALGPDLAGAARRFSRDDLFTAIVAPNRDVSSRYRTTQVLTTKGQLYTGIIAYQSVDGMLLRTSLNETVRIEAHEMEFQRQRTISLMPRDLLRDLKDQDLADLYAYLKGLE